MSKFCHPEFGCDCHEGISLTREQGLEILAMLESLLGVAHEKGCAPEMPCDDAWCGYSLCEFMRKLQKMREAVA